MTGIQASGAGSGLDISSLVTQLVAAERQPLDARLTRRESAATVQISALANLKGALGSLRDALSSLRTITSFSARTAVSSDAEVLTASASADVQPGTFDVEVVSLASAQKLVSGVFVGGRTSVVGTGTLTLSLGDESFSIDVESGAATLADIRDAINESTDNPGISATILNEVGGSRLVLTSRATGADNVIEVAQSGGDGGLAALVYDPDVPASNGFEQKSPAADALVRVNGYDYESASNTVTGAIDGLTLNLWKQDPGTTLTVTVTNDTTTVGQRIRKFVTDYNSLAKVFRDLQKYDASTGKAGAMLGDAYVRGLESQVRRDLADPVSDGSGAYDALAEIGITSSTTGQLVVNDTKLAAALAKDFDSVARLFSGDDGVAVRLYDRLDDELAGTAQLASRTTTLNDQIKAISKERDAVDARMASVEARYRAQFTALDQLLTSMKTTSNFLSQQLGSSG